ncbi:glycosyltransferase family 4 protein [Marinoscillum sp. MHG1-6]|uniref:glycosyltransferase family 4 protein n=1 Tax=Marinoscillum sp. MHG1-6 TaxID=2959627 RepID=UPI002157AB3B|nr:MraY family glycosyltransferase [Marinoscillum sp. MHG1-6]
MSLFIAILTGFLLTFILMPIIIKVSKSIDLLDMPDRRKVHDVSTPSFGGAAVFVGFLIAIILSISLADLAVYKFFLAGMLMIFLLGVRDDVSSLQAKQKLAVQILSAFLVVYFSEIKLQGLYGLFGLHELPYGLQEIISIFMIVVLTNSFNLVDGIDGLAGSVAVFILTVFAYFFYFSGEIVLAAMSLSLVGALMAFLFFNWYPSQVFMGDTGSMFLGFMVSVLCIKSIDLANIGGYGPLVNVEAPVAMGIALLIVPIYDTLRVFAIRIWHGRSPMVPDRNHIHHSLLNLGMTHSTATIALIIANVSTAALSLVLDQFLRQEFIILICFAFMVAFGGTVDLFASRKEQRMASLAEKDQKSLYISKSA